MLPFLLGLIGGLGFAAVMGGSSFPERYGFFSPVIDAIGVRATTYLAVSLMFGAGTTIVAWRLWAALMQLRRRMHDRRGPSARSGS